MLNKKGQGMSINAVIMIVLGIIVLAVMILGFTLGWDKIVPFLSPSNNVDDVKKDCNSACLQDKQYAFCSQKRELRTEEGAYEGTCNAFASGEGVEPKGESEDFDSRKIGVSECFRVTCLEIEESTTDRGESDGEQERGGDNVFDDFRRDLPIGP